jgi:hypothetical protein
MLQQQQQQHYHMYGANTNANLHYTDSYEIMENEAKKVRKKTKFYNFNN